MELGRKRPTKTPVSRSLASLVETHAIPKRCFSSCDLKTLKTCRAVLCKVVLYDTRGPGTTNLETVRYASN